jgi:hypothetical protein
MPSSKKRDSLWANFVVSKLWRWDRERQCYTMIEWYRFKGKPLDQKAHLFFSRM